VLKSVGVYFGCSHAVVHANLGGHLLSEEWTEDEEATTDSIRQSVNQAMLDCMAKNAPTCSRIVCEQTGSRLNALCVPMLGLDFQQAGAMALALADSDRERALEVLSVAEGIAGYIALIVAANVTGGDTNSDFDRSIFAVETSSEAEHPVHIAFTIVNELRNRFDIELAAIGFVHARHVKVVAICGMDEVRPANPGVKLIRAAMEECLDREETILVSGTLGDTTGKVEDDCRLHAQWSRESGGDPVASFPLFVGDEVVAVVSLRNGPPNGLQRADVQRLAERIAGYGAILPLCREASRGVVAHARESTGQFVRALFRCGGRRKLGLLLAACGAGLWLLVGSLGYSFTVPCSVRPAVQRVVSCPRDGVLSDLFVRPGDHVEAGQLLADLDSQDDVLRRVELRSQLDTLDAKIDKALEDGEAGMIRIYEAERKSVRAQLAIIEQMISRAQIRAPQDGIVLEGDLRERLGSKVNTGEPLFTLARRGRMSIVARIPEHLILDARKLEKASFAPTARPGARIPLAELRFSPASTIQHGMNVFLAEAEAPGDHRDLSPGMEGYAHIEVGPRRVWWVLLHRAINWFRLRFWV